MKKTSLFFLPIIFLLLLITPHVNDYFGVVKFDQIDENRAYRDSIPVDMNHLDELPEDVDTYVNDNFSFRTPFLNLYTHLNFYWFRISPKPDEVIFGRNDWYFKTGTEKKIVEGKANFSVAEKQELVATWKRRTAYLDSLNIDSYWYLAPMKHRVYPEHLPMNLVVSQHDRTLDLIEELESWRPDFTINPRNYLIQQKGKGKLFYQLDNHWTYRGGYYAATYLIDFLRKQYPNRTIPPVPEFEWISKKIHAGGHHRTIGIDELFEYTEEPVLAASPIVDDIYNFPILDHFAYKEEYEETTKTKIVNGLRVLFIRDSFAKHLIPFLAPSLSEATYIFDAWEYKLNREIIETMKPDVVIFFTLEPLIENILLNSEID